MQGCVRICLRLVVACLAMTPVFGAEPLPQELNLTVGDTQLLFADVQRMAVGNGRLLSVSTPERGQLLLLAEGAGTTTLQLWLRDGHRQRIKVVVGELDLELRLEQVRRLLDGTHNISARVAGNRIVLEGYRVNDADQTRANLIAESYPGLVLNFIGKLGWEAMIQMDVRIVEVRRDQVRDLGLRWDTTLPGPTAGVALGQVATAPAATFAFASQITSRIDLLQRQGLAETVAEPMLSCRSGGVARFVSGGEVPIPVLDGLGSTDVQYKEYGVILEVRPKADAAGTIYAEVDAELSQIDDSVRVQSFPGFIKRRSSTAVNLKAGETLVIAGLLARERGRDRQSIPGFGRLPVAGALFSTRHRLARQTELLVLITPRLVTESGQRERVDAAERIRDGSAWKRDAGKSD
jgi:pilus assembly protein CpaC